MYPFAIFLFMDSEIFCFFNCSYIYIPKHSWLSLYNVTCMSMFSGQQLGYTTFFYYRQKQISLILGNAIASPPLKRKTTGYSWHRAVGETVCRRHVRKMPCNKTFSVTCLKCNLTLWQINNPLGTNSKNNIRKYKLIGDWTMCFWWIMIHWINQEGKF